MTAPEELRLAAEALVIEMGGEPEWIAEESRPLYHAALALGANHLVTLVAQSMELLRTAGVTAPDRMLGPLLGAALDNALRSGDAALTGPVARGDAGTVAAHIGELRRHAPQTVMRLCRDGPRHRRSRTRPRHAQAGAGRGPARRPGRRHRNPGAPMTNRTGTPSTAHTPGTAPSAAAPHTPGTPRPGAPGAPFSVRAPNSPRSPPSRGRGPSS